jgi:hypothetical protein
MSHKWVHLAVIAALLSCSSRASAGPTGFMGWRFGMTPEQVKKVKTCAPYNFVKVTGGLECPNFRFLGAKRNISFVFRQGKLVKIQVWLYKGKSDGEAVTALDKLARHLIKRHGKLECKDLPRLGQLPKRMLAKYLAHFKTKPMAKLQFKPAKNPKRFFTFSSLIHHQRHGLFLFMYLQPPR